jgi:hypothetical protein
MKKYIYLAALVVTMLAACGKQTAQDKINRQIEDKVHALTADERALAETNAKQFFNREFPQTQIGPDGAKVMGTARGMFLDCRPSDTNYNGLVTCHGVMPVVGGGFNDKATRYCGYTVKLVGCSDEDTVK